MVELGAGLSVHQESENRRGGRNQGSGPMVVLLLVTKKHT